MIHVTLGKKPRTWYVVTGRVSFDDEDSVFVLEAENLQEAERAFHVELRERRGDDFDEDRDVIYMSSATRVVSDEPPEVEFVVY